MKPTLKYVGPLALLTAAALLTACGGGATSGNTFDHIEDPVEAARRGEAVPASKPGKGVANEDRGDTGQREGAAAETAQQGSRYDALGRLDPNGNYDVNGALLPGVVLQPVQEREDAIERISGIKTKLTAKLNEVREQLKDGTLDKELAATYKEQAADLGQGLERVNRMLKAMGEADDATWSEMRDSGLKEVQEVRTWWRGYADKQKEVSASE